MLTALEFDNEVSRETAEIGEVEIDAVLATEFESGKTLGSEVLHNLRSSFEHSVRNRRPRSRKSLASEFIIVRLTKAR
jgi:hypothetical protein